jgi:STE24 endopeptidase
MHALIIAAFAVLYLGEELGAPLVPSLRPYGMGWLAATAASVVAAVWLYASHHMRGLDRDGSIRRVRRVERAASVARWALLAAHATAVLVFGLLAQVRDHVTDLVALDELAALAPLVLALAAVEFAVYPVERRLRDALLIRSLDEGRPIHPYPPRVRFVWLWSRHHIFFVLIPLSILLAWSETAPRLVPASVSDPAAREAVVAAVQVAGLGAVFALIPPLLVRVWDTVPLAESPLRERLEAMCRAHRARVRDLLVWRTGGLVLNGAAIGLFAPLRYIVLTDALLEQLTERQAEAVAAHEVGHVRRRHTLWLALAVLAAVLAGGTATGWAVVTAETLARVAPGSPADRGAIGVALVVTLGFTLMVLGRVPRRSDRLADASALRHLSGEGGRGDAVSVTAEAADAMAGALARVARAHAIDTRRPTFRHGSILGRQRALAGAVGERTDRLAADRVARRARWAIVGLLLVGILLAGVDVLVNG